MNNKFPFVNLINTILVIVLDICIGISNYYFYSNGIKKNSIDIILTIIMLSITVYLTLFTFLGFYKSIKNYKDNIK